MYEFEVPLPYRGIGVSSHGEDRGARFPFGLPSNRPRPPFNRTRIIGKTAPEEGGWVDWDGPRRWRVSGFDG